MTAEALFDKGFGLYPVNQSVTAEWDKTGEVVEILFSWNDHWMIGRPAHRSQWYHSIITTAIISSPFLCFFISHTLFMHEVWAWNSRAEDEFHSSSDCSCCFVLCCVLLAVLFSILLFLWASHDLKNICIFWFDSGGIYIKMNWIVAFWFSMYSDALCWQSLAGFFFSLCLLFQVSFVTPHYGDMQ